VKNVALKTEERKKDERFPVFAVGLVLEPLTYDQAKQLGPEVLGHCFTNKQQIRELMSEVVVTVDQPEQILVARMAADVEENARLRHVRIKRIKITKRDLSGDSKRKSKKVAPQQATLRATLECLVDSAEKTHRDFLCGFFARTMYFTFENEQEDLFAGVYTGDEENDDTEDDEPELAGIDAPQPDPAAGDVLDEKPKRTRVRVMTGPASVRKSKTGKGKGKK